MAPLSRIMHQIARTILHSKFCYIYTLIVMKTTNNAFSMTPLSRIVHQVAKIIFHLNIFYNYTLIVIKTTDDAFSMTPLSRIRHQVAKIILHLNFFYIYNLIVMKTTNNALPWSRCLGSCTRLLEQYFTVNFFLYLYINSNENHLQCIFNDPVV